MNRRHFLRLLAAGLLAYPVSRAAAQTDWTREKPIVETMRRSLEDALTGKNMALDIRAINALNDQEFQITINSTVFFPVASAFKAFIAPYYFLYTPPGAWQFTPGTDLYSSIVFSSNTATGAVLAETAQYAPGDDNPIEKFNNFLYEVIGIGDGLYGWDYEGSRTVGFGDPRYLPGNGRVVRLNGEAYRVDNVFSAEALARGWDVLTRGVAFAKWDTLRIALEQANALLSIPAGAYQSPIERVFPAGYTGKDGVLPVDELEVGRVINDAGVLTIGTRRYIVAFMSMSEGELTIIDTLKVVVDQLQVYDAAP